MKEDNPIVNDNLNNIATFFWRFGLFLIDPSEANNPISDSYSAEQPHLSSGVEFSPYQTWPKSSCFRQQTVHHTFQMKSSCLFWKSGLFFIDNDYLNNLATLTKRFALSQANYSLYIPNEEFELLPEVRTVHRRPLRGQPHRQRLPEQSCYLFLGSNLFFVNPS